MGNYRCDGSIKPQHGRRLRLIRSKSINKHTMANICQQLASGISLTRICASPSMPCYDTVQRMLRADEDFARELKIAREIYYQRLADEVIDISDDSKNDYMACENGARKLDKEHIWRSKVRVETRQWLLSRVLPKIYGAKQMDEQVAGKITGDIKAIIAEVAAIARGEHAHPPIEAEIVQEVKAGALPPAGGFQKDSGLKGEV